MLARQFCMSRFIQEAANRHACGVIAESPEANAHWLVRALKPHSTRISVAAQRRLFASGDAALGYYLVLSGQLLVHRRSAISASGRPKASIRLVEAGDLLNNSCSGVHDADCDALHNTQVLRIDHRRFQLLAALDQRLRSVRIAVNDSELAWMQQSFRSDFEIL